MPPDLSLGRMAGRRDLLDQARPHLGLGRGVLAIGEPGIGRTTLADALAGTAQRHDGWTTLWIVATESLRSVPFGAVSPLLEPGGASQPSDRIAAVVQAMRSHGERGRTALVVDDAHLLDDRSADVVLQAVSTRAAALIATAVSGAPLPDGIRRLVDDGFVHTVSVGRFDRAATADVVGEIVGGPPNASTAELLWRWSGGVPALLTAIVEAGQQAGRLRPIDGRWWWIGPTVVPDEVSTLLERRLARLSDGAAAALDLIALGEPLDVRLLEQLVAPTALAELEHSGLVTAHSQGWATVVHCSSALIAPQRVRHMPLLRRRLLSTRLIDSLPVTDASGHAAAVSVARAAQLHLWADEPAATRLLWEAGNIARLSDPAVARELAEFNHRWSPSATTLADLIDSHVEEGELDHARQLFERAEALAASPADVRRLVDAEYAINLFGDRDPQAALAVLRQASAAHDGHERGELDSLESLAWLLSARPDLVMPLARAALAAPETTPTGRLRAGMTLTAAMLLGGRTADALAEATVLLERAENMVGRMPSALGMLHAEVAFLQLWRNELTGLPPTDPRTGRWPMPPLTNQPHDSDVSRFEWALMAGIVAHLHGQHDEAVARLRDAVVHQRGGKGIFHAEACAWLVVALCDAGRRSDAEAAMAQFPQRHLAVLPGMERWARGVLHSTAGDTVAGAAELLAAADDAAQVGAFLLEAMFLVEMADRAQHDNDIEVPVGRLDELSRSIDAPLLQRLCRVAVARLKRDSGQLLAEAEHLAAVGLITRSRAVTRAAEQMARSDGNAEVARRANTTRRQLGRARAATTGGLTGRESEIAELAAGGLSDREIAARLVVSVRTVESHLARVYRKLTITSRVALADALEPVSH